MMRWYDPLKPICADVRTAAASDIDLDVVLFYLARWCQKRTAAPEPDVLAFDEHELTQVAAKIAVNLTSDARRVDALVAGDPSEWSRLRRLLFTSARPRAGAEADEHTDEALQQIAVVLLTGTPPSLAAARLAEGPTGPRNEYVFASPFELWARTVVINHIIDEQRRHARQHHVRPSADIVKPPPHLDTSTLAKARDALPALLDAVRALPPVQRSVMVLTLARSDIDDLAREHLHSLAPDLFHDLSDCSVRSDADIADRLGTTSRLVVANRSAARCKLAARDPLWALLLDVLMPHRSPSASEEV